MFTLEFDFFFIEISILTLWLLSGWGGRPQSIWFCCFLYLLNFFREWHLCKFLFFRRPFSPSAWFNFPCPTSQKMRVGVSLNLPPPHLSLSFSPHCFLKNSLKSLLRHFLYVSVFTHLQALFRQLGPSFSGWKFKQIWQIIHIFLFLFHAEGSSKTSCWYLLQRKFN